VRAGQLLLEDGFRQEGLLFGAAGEAVGEVVFNTAMSGYQEVITDPSYHRQIVVMTSPMMGNYGIAPEDFEGRRAAVAGLVVRELSRVPSNWRQSHSLPDYLLAQGIAGIAGVDTRALVRHLRDHGAMRGWFGAVDAQPRIDGCPPMQGLALATEVTADAPYAWTEGSVFSAAAAATHRVTVLDYGVKRGILRRLVDQGCAVQVVPAGTCAADVLATDPQGILLSNGPGDPEPLQAQVEVIRELLGRRPIFGICLGHQLLSLALGAKTYKLPFGHHGCNHPVQDLATARIEITSHNHGFAVHSDGLPASVEVTHINLNDRTIEGIRARDQPAFSIQYHPEASPGPHDALYLFGRFKQLMNDAR
jgi:carbamoyl-phosphate synthase small subunit